MSKVKYIFFVKILYYFSVFLTFWRGGDKIYNGVIFEVGVMLTEKDIRIYIARRYSMKYWTFFPISCILQSFEKEKLDF